MSSGPGIAAAGKWKNLQPALSEPVLRVITERLGFSQMTPVQAATLPKFLQHKDVAVEAPTGSGKTLSFMIPILEKLLKREDRLKPNEVGAIVITPTRELAQQIFNVVQPFIEEINLLSVLLLIGGTDVPTDIKQYKEKGANIVIATPGRLDDVMQRMGAEFKVKELEVLVLDEADRLLDMGFSVTLGNILARLPKQRRTVRAPIVENFAFSSCIAALLSRLGLFSATQTREVSELMKAGLRNPVKIVVKVEDKASKAVQSIPSTLQNLYVKLSSDQKLNQLVNFILQHKDKKVIVYFLTCACVNFFWWALRELEQLKQVPIFSLHGQVPAKKRIEVYNSFVALESGVLLSTDLSARGLDFQDVDWIIQFDPPQDPNFFIHRIGRTARSGREGKAIVYLMPNEETFIEFLGVRNVPIQETAAASSVKDFLSQVKKNATKERELVEKSVSAFTSYFRAYKEHKLGYIFRLKDLDLPSVARSYALLRLPRMPEMSLFNTNGFEEAQVDLEKIPYKEKRREKQRQEKLKRLKEAREEKLKQKERDDAMEEDNDDADGSSRSDDELEDDSADTDSDQKQGDDHDSDSDEDDWAKEARLMKKLKQGKITEEEFEEALGEKTLEDDIVTAQQRARDKKKRKLEKQDKKRKQQAESGQKLFDRVTQSKKRKNKFNAFDKATKKRKLVQ